ncbi:FAD-dependent oxidoreductase [Enterovirga aerilata]|uniref:FAD-binding oxidoreductase n=1 Tax=Enterovirga aerilata TaxID=2730920 RepID=A0A849IA70_9HYPH|nr:FAD-binding oxidoreductase [Enterovirga sp. DB1703]
MTRSADVVIIGAGIVGASIAYALGRRGIGRVVLLEAEVTLNVHSTGRNASYFLPIYDTACFSALAQASLPFFESPPDGFSDAPLLSRRGAVIAALETDADALAAEIAAARSSGVEVKSLAPADVAALVPIVRTDWFAAAAHYPGAGPLDVHALSMGYLSGARRAGVELHLAERCEAIETARGRVVAVRTNAHRYVCGTVVNAAGAWAAEIAAMCGARPIAFEPRRRHIASIPLPATGRPHDWAFFRCPSLPFYMKPEPGQLLASLMDAELDEPGDCMSDDLRVAEIVDTVERLTTLEVRRVTRAWAGHRTFSPDGAPVIGPDPAIAGFVWAAGLGGAGVMSSPAVGDLVAAAVDGSRAGPLQEQVAPARRMTATLEGRTTPAAGVA